MPQERDCSALFFVQVSGALPHAGWPQACVLSLGTQDFLPCSALLTLHGNWQDAPQEAASQQTRTQTHRQKEGAQAKLARQECSMQVPGGHWGSFLKCQEVFSKLLPWSPLDPVRGILEWHTCPKELKIAQRTWSKTLRPIAYNTPGRSQGPQLWSLRAAEPCPFSWDMGESSGHTEGPATHTHILSVRIWLFLITLSFSNKSISMLITIFVDVVVQIWKYLLWDEGRLTRLSCESWLSGLVFSWGLSWLEDSEHLNLCGNCCHVQSLWICLLHTRRWWMLTKFIVVIKSNHYVLQLTILQSRMSIVT